jgi:hypothetical protein
MAKLVAFGPGIVAAFSGRGGKPSIPSFDFVTRRVSLAIHAG